MLIFDFDGVLLDSLDEVTVTAYNAVTNDLITSIEELPGQLVDLFKKNRFHFQPAGDAILLMRWCLNIYEKSPDKLLSPAEYRTIIRKNRIPLIKRTNRFYARRKQFIVKEKPVWLALHKPYQPLWNELIKHGSERVIILTNKNREAVQRLSLHFGLNIPAENIFSGDDGVTKVTNLHRIHERFHRHRYELIDDSIKNLRELDQKINDRGQLLIPILASWGYIGPTSILDAEKYQYLIYDQRQLLDVLEKKLP